jgi:hypothetical protein
MQDKHGLLTQPIADILLKLTTPMVFGMVAILLFNLVDTFFISLLGTDALAAVSFTFPVTFAVNCITWRRRQTHSIDPSIHVNLVPHYSTSCDTHVEQQCNTSDWRY